MEPMTMAAIGMGAGGALSAMGGMKAGNAQAQIADYNARLMERNQETAKNMAAHNLLLAKADIIQSGNDAARTISGIDAHFGAAGVSAGGSTLTVAMESARRADEELTIGIYNANKENLEMRERALAFGMQAAITRAEGKARQRAARSEAIGSLLSTAGSIGMKYA